MKFFFLCRQVCNNPSDISIVKEYTDEPTATTIEQFLLDTISDEMGEGKKQATIAIQTDRTVEEIKGDDTLPNNHYIRKEGNTYYIYEKCKSEVETPGWFSTSKTAVIEVNKLYMYTVVEHKLELYNYITQAKPTGVKMDTPVTLPTFTFIEQMRDIFAMLNRPTDKNIQLSNLNFGEKGVTKYRASSFRKGAVINKEKTVVETAANVLITPTPME
jgi:hypothetical protein